MDGFVPKRVLVPVDFTDTSTVALAAARRFASGYGAELLALFADTTVIGTTTERILRHAHCPVMTVIRKVEAPGTEKRAAETTATSS